jgi:hypothetical protein
MFVAADHGVGGNTHGSKLHPQKMKHAKGELKARPSHPPLTGRLLICSLRSAITSRSEHVVSRQSRRKHGLALHSQFLWNESENNHGQFYIKRTQFNHQPFAGFPVTAGAPRNCMMASSN